MPINEPAFRVSDFDSKGRMDFSINLILSKNEVIRLRNFLTQEIERVQKPIAEMLDKVGGNVSPEI